LARIGVTRILINQAIFALGSEVVKPGEGLLQVEARWGETVSRSMVPKLSGGPVETAALHIPHGLAPPEQADRSAFKAQVLTKLAFYVAPIIVLNQVGIIDKQSKGGGRTVTWVP
jgi:hypothetical protein